MISAKRRHQYVLSFSLFATLNSSLTPYYKSATSQIPYCLNHFTCCVVMTSTTSQWTARDKVAPNKVHSAEFLVSCRFPCRV